MYIVYHTICQAVFSAFKTFSIHTVVVSFTYCRPVFLYDETNIVENFCRENSKYCNISICT